MHKMSIKNTPTESWRVLKTFASQGKNRVQHDAHNDCKNYNTWNYVGQHHFSGLDAFVLGFCKQSEDNVTYHANYSANIEIDLP